MDNIDHLYPNFLGESLEWFLIFKNIQSPKGCASTNLFRERNVEVSISLCPSHQSAFPVFLGCDIDYTDS